jgi:hypothetical protein
MLLTLVLSFYYGLINSNQVDAITIKDYIVTEALVVGVDPQMAIGIAEAEGQFDTNSVGDHGTSYGTWQIHLPAHKDITKEQATNLIWSTQWSLNEMKKNGCKIWSTCEQVMKKISQSGG